MEIRTKIMIEQHLFNGDSAEVLKKLKNDGSVSNSNDHKWKGGDEKNWVGHTNKRIHTYSDKGTNSRYYDLDKWFDKVINEL